MAIYVNKDNEIANIEDEFDTKTGFNKSELKMKNEGFTRVMDITNGQETLRVPASEYNKFAKEGFVDVEIAKTQQKAQQDFQNEANSSAAEAFALGVGKGVTFKNIDELAGAGAALTGGSYTGTRDINRDVHAEAERERPWVYGGGELVGNVLGSIGLGRLLGAVGATAGLVTKAPTLAGNIANIAKVGGIEGAFMGAGGSEADLTKGEVGQFALDTALGGGIGAGAGALGAGVVAGAPKAAEKARTFFTSERFLDPATQAQLKKIGNEGASKAIGEGGLLNKVAQGGKEADEALKQIGGQANRQKYGAEAAISGIDDAMATTRNKAELLNKQAGYEDTLFMKEIRPENKLAIQELRRMTSDELATKLPELQNQASQRFRESIEAAGAGIDSSLLGNQINAKLGPVTQRYMTATAAEGTRGFHNEVVGTLQDTVRRVNNKLTTNPEAAVSELYDFIRTGRAAAKAAAKQGGGSKADLAQIDDAFFSLLPENMASKVKAADVDYSKFIKRSNAIKGATKNAKTSGSERYLQTTDGTTRVAERVGSSGALKAAGANPEQLKQLFPELSDAQALNYGRILQNSDDPVMLAALERDGAFIGLPDELVGPIKEQARRSGRLIQSTLAGKQRQIELAEQVGQNLEAKQAIEQTAVRPAKDIIENIGFQGTQNTGKTQSEVLEGVLAEVKDQLPGPLKAKFFDPVTGERLAQSPALTAADRQLLEDISALRQVKGYNANTAVLEDLPTRSFALPLPGGKNLGWTAPTRDEALLNRARSFEAGQLGEARLGRGVETPLSTSGLGRIAGQQIGQSYADPAQLAEIEKKVSPAAKAELKILKLRPASSITPEVIAGLAKKHGLTEDEVRLMIGSRR